MLEMKPEAVFIDVGGNDITSTTEPREILVYYRVKKIVEDIDQVGTGDLLIAEIMTRGDIFKSPDPILDHIRPPTPKNQ